MNEKDMNDTYMMRWLYLHLAHEHNEDTSAPHMVMLKKQADGYLMDIETDGCNDHAKRVVFGTDTVKGQDGGSVSPAKLLEQLTELRCQLEEQNNQSENVLIANELLRDEYIQVKNENRKLKIKHETLNQQTTNLRGTCKNLKDSVCKYQGNLRKKDREIANQISINDQLKKSLNVADNTIADLTHTIKTVDRQLEKSKSDYVLLTKKHESSVIRNNDLIDEKRILTEENRSTLKIKNKYEASLANILKRADSLQMRLDAVDKRCIDYAEEVRVANHTIDQLRDEKAAMLLACNESMDLKEKVAACKTFIVDQKKYVTNLVQVSDITTQLYNYSEQADNFLSLIE